MTNKAHIFGGGSSFIGAITREAGLPGFGAQNWIGGAHRYEANTVGDYTGELKQSEHVSLTPIPDRPIMTPSNIDSAMRQQPFQDTTLRNKIVKSPSTCDSVHTTMQASPSLNLHLDVAPERHSANKQGSSLGQKHIAVPQTNTDALATVSNSKLFNPEILKQHSTAEKDLSHTEELSLSQVSDEVRPLSKKREPSPLPGSVAVGSTINSEQVKIQTASSKSSASNTAQRLFRINSDPVQRPSSSRELHPDVSVSRPSVHIGTLEIQIEVPRQKSVAPPRVSPTFSSNIFSRLNIRGR